VSIRTKRIDGGVCVRAQDRVTSSARHVVALAADANLLNVMAT
jgi:hypothetical protein